MFGLRFYQPSLGNVHKFQIRQLVSSCPKHNFSIILSNSRKHNSQTVDCNRMG
jgi:hypothetical protein